MRQSGHYTDAAPLTEERFRAILGERIAVLDVAKARVDVVQFLSDTSTVAVWSREFFATVAEKVKMTKPPRRE